MSVIPCHLNILKNKQELTSFILACKQNNSILDEAEIISISKSIEKIDPLVFLSSFISPNQVSFYWENQRKQEAVVAIGTLKKFEVNSGHCPEDCQQFIDYLLPKIARFGNDDSSKFPLFFAYFRFFNEEDKYNITFPSANIFIPKIQLFKKENQYSLVVNLLNNIQEDNLNFLDPYFEDNFLKEYSQNKLNEFSDNQPNKQQLTNKQQITRDIDEKEYNSFLQKVNKALKVIEREKLSKVVVSHALDISTPKQYNIIATLANLRNNHPDCYIFSVSNDHNDYFIGASPERLLSIQDKQLVTDALAGSAPRGKTDLEDQTYGEILLNSEKEKREHDAVSKFIMQCLSQLDLAPKKASLQLLKLSNIQHLWTPIYAEISSNLKPLEIISKLHPTPAVAGVPLDLAYQEIKALESFDRSLYAAPLGWIDSQGNCEFIVGIRSALIQKNKARLYAGAGLVSGSDPYQELAEIKLKFQAVLQSLI
jgi:menaquinone-specific isochorismate synthase